MITSATNSLRWPANRRAGVRAAAVLAVLFFVVGAMPLAGADVYIRNVGDNGQCLIVLPGASNSTPIEITCQAAHNLAAGDVIRIANVAGNFAANGMRKVKAVTASNKFTITDMDGVDVAGSGTWTRGDQAGPVVSWIGGVQRAGRATARTLKSHPRLLLDPEGWTLLQFAASVENGILVGIAVSGGVATATYSRAHELTAGQKVCVYGSASTALNCPTNATPASFYTISATPTSTTLQFTVPGGVANGSYATSTTTVSAWAHGGNPAWLGVQTNRALIDAYYQVPGADAVRERSLNFALMCYVNRNDTNACNVAKWAITHAEDIGVNFGLDETQNYGGDPNVDYIAFKLFSIAQIYTLIRAQLTVPEREEFARKMLNDLRDPVLGGDCAKLLRIDKPGTIVKAGDFLSSLTITGTGTSFLTDLQPGMVLLPPTGVLMYESQQVYVTQVLSDTVAKGTGVGWDGPYSVIPNRTANSCGALWYSKHHPSGPFAHPLYYPPQGGTSIYGVAPLSNITITKTWAYLAVGLALADDDVRARELVGDMTLYFMDNTWPVVRNMWTGFSGSGSNYHYARVSYMISDIINMLRFSVQGGPDLTAGQHLKNMGAHLRFMWVPNGSNLERYGIWSWGADGSPEILDWSGGRPAALGAAMSINPADPEVHRTNYWLRNVFSTFDGETIGSASALYAAGVFLRTPPTLAQIDYRAGPTQRIFRGVDRSVCLAQGSVPCPAEGGFEMIVSRTGWTNPNDTAIGFEAADFWADHSVQRASDYVVYKGSWLLAGDSWGGSAQAGTPEYVRSNLHTIPGIPIARGEVSANYGHILSESYNSRVPRWAGGDNDEGVAASEYAYWLNDITNTYTGTNMRRQHRHVAHLKKPGAEEHMVIYDDAATNIDTSFRFYTHYAQNGQPGEATTSCPTDCAFLDADREMRTQTPGPVVNSVTTRFLALPDMPVRVYVDNANGTFPGGLGRSFRVTTCAAAPGGGSCAPATRAYEMVTVHRIAAGAPAAANVTAINTDAAWTGVRVPGQTVLFARKGAIIRGLPATPLTHSGSSSLLVTGLAAGTYRLQLDGLPVAGCEGDIAVAANDTTLYCAAVGAGSVQVVPTSNAHSGRTGNSGRLGGTISLRQQ